MHEARGIIYGRRQCVEIGNGTAVDGPYVLAFIVANFWIFASPSRRLCLPAGHLMNSDGRFGDLIIYVRLTMYGDLIPRVTAQFPKARRIWTVLLMFFG